MTKQVITKDFLLVNRNHYWMTSVGIALKVN